jgi:hypothetical protein
MSFLLCLWFAFKVFLAVVLVIGSIAGFTVGLGYSFFENTHPFKWHKLWAFPTVLFILIAIWVYVIANVDIEKAFTFPKDKPAQAQVQLAENQ